MGNSTMIRKVLGAVVALAILVVGVSIGSRLAGLLEGEPVGQVMVVHHMEEDPQRRAVAAPEAVVKHRQEAERELAAARPQADQEHQRREADSAVKQPSEDERRLADALRWAERYRQGRDAIEREAVSKQRQEETHKLAQAQVEQGRPQQEIVDHKLADVGPKPGEGGRSGKLRLVRCAKSCTAGFVRRRDGMGRVARHPRARLNHPVVGRGRNSICPLGWLLS